MSGLTYEQLLAEHETAALLDAYEAWEARRARRRLVRARLRTFITRGGAR